MDKTYIGKVEAFEIALLRGCELPRKGKENLTVYAIAENKKTEVIGKDEQGYYIAEL